MKQKYFSMRSFLLFQCLLISLATGTLTGCSGNSDEPGNTDHKPPLASAPVADAGGNATYNLGVGDVTYDVTLDGSGSSDSDGAIVTYTWTGTPDPDDVAAPVVSLPFGSHNFTLVVTDDDGLDSAPATITITIAGPVTPSAHHPPEITLPASAFAMDEGALLTFDVTAEDPDGDPVSLSASTKISNAEFTATAGNHAQGTFSFTPEYSQQGYHVVVFTATDAYGNKSSKTAVIQVANVNQPPILNLAQTAAVDEGGTLTLSVTATDPDGDTLTYTAQSLPENAVMVPSAGALTFLPDYDQAGTYTITCEVTDGQYTDTKSIVITVNDVATGGIGQPRELVLTVSDLENPSFLTAVRVSGSVNPGTGAPAPQGRQSTLIKGLSPASGKQGQTLDVTITGESVGDYATGFIQGLSQAVFSDGITVNSLTVNSPTQAMANITVSGVAAKGPRLVTVTTGSQTAVSVVSFNVINGTATITGTLMSDAGTPVANALITVEGTQIQTATGADGSFALLEVPADAETLIINAANHALTYLDISTRNNTEVDLDEVEIAATVFDPSAEPGATIGSLLNRGIGDITGSVTLEEAEQMILDAIICVGGTEAGVLDAYGNQLNPSVEGLGKTSFTHNGVKNYARRMAMGQSTTLMELFMDISFAFAWDPAPPTFKELLDGMQAAVNQAWDNPEDPASRIPILLFNRGDSLNPNPPKLEANTRISMFQAYLAVNSFMTTIYNHRDEWGNVTGHNISDQHPLLAAFINSFPFKWLAPVEAKAEDAPGIYTITWENMLDSLSKTPSGSGISTGSTTTTTLPDFEALLKNYYLDLTDTSLTKAKELLIATFPTYFTDEKIKELFDNNPYNLKTAMEELIDIGINDQDVALLFQKVAERDGQTNPGSANLWSFWDMEKGETNNLLYNRSKIPNYFKPDINPMSYPTLIVQAMPISAPYIYTSTDATTTLSTPNGNLDIPAAKVLFFPSSDDAYTASNEKFTFVYRLWRVEQKREKTAGSDDENRKYNLTLVAYGQLDEDKTLAPKAEPKTDTLPNGLYAFKVPLPPAGMNVYQVDCIRFKGDRSLIANIDPQEFDSQLTPWLSGYLDEPTTWNPTEGISSEIVHPARGVFRNLNFSISALSKSSSVYISGKAAGFSTFGQFDLAVDYSSKDKIYISLPEYKTSGHGDRGTGSIFRYDADTGELKEFSRPGFITPGQTGLAIDSHLNLYTENAATEAGYGGKLFRILGHRNSNDPGYNPNYPSPNYQDPAAAAAGTSPSRLYVGNVNYYSRLLQRSNPVAIAAMTMGKASGRDLGEELYIADLMGSGAGTLTSGGIASQIKRVAVQSPEIKNHPPDHNVGELWAWNDTADTSAPQNDEDWLKFDDLTEMVFKEDESALYITQGAYVIQAFQGKNKSFSITQDGTLFTSASGCDICEDNGAQFLFVADRAEGSILKIPLSDLVEPRTGAPGVFQIKVPSDAVERERLINRYTFFKDLDHPSHLRITDDGQGMVVLDNTGLRYLNFGFTSRAYDGQGNPLINAVVTIKTLAGESSTTTDSEGYYHFLETDEYSVIAEISHPDWSYSQRILMSKRCQYSSDEGSRPCIVITTPVSGAFTAAEAVTVKGTILPKDIDFTLSGGLLEAIRPGGERTEYTLSFTGNDNDFTVSGVQLSPGTNHLIASTYRTGQYGTGGSLVTEVTRTTATISVQAVSDIALDSDGNPLRDADVQIFVDDILQTVVETDGCGYYNAQNLPLGNITVNIIE